MECPHVTHTTDQRPSDAGEQTRRTFLKKTGATGTLAAVPAFNVGRSDRQADDFHQGTKRVVGLKIEHPDADDRIPTISPARGVPNTYVYDGRLFLVTVDPEEIRGPHDALLRSPLNVTRFSGSTTFGQGSRLYHRSDYDGQAVQLLDPESGYEPFALDVSFDGKTAVATLDGEEVLRVRPGAERSVALPEQSVTVKTYGEAEEREIRRPGVEGTTTVHPVVGTEEVAVTPQLTLRNDGSVDVFGAAKAAVVPNVREFPVRGLVDGNRASETIDVETVPDSDLVVIHREYDYRPVVDQRGCE